MGLTQKLGTIPLAIQTDSSNNVGIGGAANASYKLAVTGAGNFTGALRTSSTFTSGDTIQLGLASTDGGFWTWGSTISYLVAATGKALNLNPNGASGTTGLSIATTGAATFSSSVTAGTSIQAGSGVSRTGGFLLNYASNASSRNWRIQNDELVYGDFAIMQSTTQTGTNYTFPFYVNPSGNVGIGTSSPLSKLSIGGSGYADRAITAIASGTDFAATIQQASTGAGLQVFTSQNSWGNTPFKIQSNTGTQFEILTNGQVNITTSSNNPLVLANASNNQYFLINTTGGGEAMTEYRNPTAASWFVGIRTAAGLSATNGFHIYSSIYGNDVMGLYANGNYAFAGSNVSDRRLKENIEAISYNALEKINALEACSYNMINNPNVKRHGFIAQEVQKVLPDLINGEEKEDEYLGLDYNGLLAIAIKAIQELNAKVTALENR